MDSRLVDLEIRYSHLEKQLLELNQVVFEQQKTLSLLQEQVASLRGRVAGMGEPMPDEKPPHY